MNKILVVLCWCALVLPPGNSRAESADLTERSLKAAESKLACCYQQASELLVAWGRNDFDAVLKKSQNEWKKYRDADVAFEMGDVRRDDESGRQFYAAILLRLTNERIEIIQRTFEHTLCNASDIRVRNASDVDFKDVIVGDKKYGGIKKGTTTDYQHWSVAYQYSYLTLTADSKSIKIQPIDFVGAVPLGEGKFTYVLSFENGRIENGQLKIRAVKDEP